MSDIGERITFSQLLERHQRVQIPMIQRDYAQGRPKEEEVRNRFLDALHRALTLSPEDQSLPLNLDFIYGSVEGDSETSFLPLDGQQRLTTLWLLHWYLAWQDSCLDRLQSIFYAQGHSRFSYSVRPSSTEFFDALTRFVPEAAPEEISSVSDLITDQPWYFRYWRLDPTIQSSLTMLDSIHERFGTSKGVFARLCDSECPAITFQLLDLEHFGLSDDLYIKMNARGKPLTEFETFKARYEQEITTQSIDGYRVIDGEKFSITDFVARRMDTAWSDLFWTYRDRRTNLYDNAFMNVFRALALVTRDPESDSYEADIGLLRSEGRAPSYTDFYTRKWLDTAFTESLICLLELWSRDSGSIAVILPNKRYFDENAIFSKILENPASLTYPQIVQFAAYVFFIHKHERNLDPQAFQEWMRVIFNLSENTYYYRTADLQRSIAGMQALIPMSASILMSLTDSKLRITGFDQEQIAEERLKAELILQNMDWRPLVDRAEGHGYFRGQIGFLFDFSGVLATYESKDLDSFFDSVDVAEEDRSADIHPWSADLHRSLQTKFEQYLMQAEAMFNATGLIDLGKYRWQRALLSIGNYLLPSGRQNSSFLVNSSTAPDSWKRLLGGTSLEVQEARQVLLQLWDRLDGGISSKKQLDKIINDADVIDEWRSALVKTPAAIEYCENRVIRWLSDKEVYLLKRKQMNGDHAELYTFCLYHNILTPLSSQGRLNPLKLEEYETVYSADYLPYIRFTFNHEGLQSSVRVSFWNGYFNITLDHELLPSRPDVVTKICDSLKFEVSDDDLVKKVSPQAIKKTLVDLAQTLATIL